MLIVLNGYPGVGKLTIAQELLPKISGRLLDIHSVYNIAFALTEFKSPAFIETVEKIEAIAHDLILQLPANVPVVLTTVLAGEGAWGEAEWLRIQELALKRGGLYVVHINCGLDENIRRIQSAGRGAKRKPQDTEMALRNQTQAKVLFGGDEERLLKLDVTELSAEEAADKIFDWLKSGI